MDVSSSLSTIQNPVADVWLVYLQPNTFTDHDGTTELWSTRQALIPFAELGHSEHPSPELRSAVLSRFSFIRRLAVFLRVDDTGPYWLPALYWELPYMVELTIVGERTEAAGYSVLSHQPNIFTYCGPLTSLCLYCVTMDWERWLPPASLNHLTIAYRQHPSDDNIPSPPDHDPGDAVPTLDRLIVILSSPRNLTKLTLSGCFRYNGHSSITLHTRPQLRLESLRELSLSGDGPSLDALCRSLIIPVVNRININSSDWRNIQSLRLLTRQLRLTSTTSTVVPFIYLGGRAGIARTDSVYVDWMELPGSRRLARLEACQIFSDRASSNWTHLLVQAAFDRVRTMIIVDKRSYHLPPRAPLSRAEEWAAVS